jgi:SAM-dependent methyltransferase
MESTRLYVKQGYGIARCDRCGLVYANPRAPRDKILARYSRDYFWTEYLPSLGVVGYDFDLAGFDVRYGALLHMLGEAVPGRRLLEVGCGAGFFLKAAERLGWNVLGIELSDEAARFAATRLGLNVRRQRAEDAPIPPGSFDAAGMFDTIEHLFDPRSVLTAIARALAPGGVLAITTPNFDSITRHLLGVDWAVLSPLEHVYYFQERTLARLLESCGFSRIRFVRRHIMWGPLETVNPRYSHAPDATRAKLTALLVRAGGFPLARTIQTLGWQDSLLCLAFKA